MIDGLSDSTYDNQTGVSCLLLQGWSKRICKFFAIDILMISQFFLKQKIPDNIKTSIITNELIKKLINNRLHLLSNSENISMLEDLNIVVYYNNTGNHPKEFLRNLTYTLERQFNGLLQRCTIHNFPDNIIEIGSIYDDKFLTIIEDITYEFTGGEGSDIYEILPSKYWTAYPDYVVINNDALLYYERVGLDVLDISAFEYLNPKISLEKINYYLANKSLCIRIHYDVIGFEERKIINIIFLKYFVHQNFRHTVVRLSRSNDIDVLYDINFCEKN